MIPVYQGYASQYGRGLGNVLGGLVRAAIPFVKKVAKSAGAKLLNAGVNFVAGQVNKRKRPTLPQQQNKRRAPRKKKSVGAPSKKKSVARKKKPEVNPERYHKF